MIALIAAVSINGVIGKDGKLPWHIPEDLKRFKEITRGKAVLMGRKTFESIIEYLGKPLPERKNIVITRQKNYEVPKDVLIYHSIESALAAHKNEDIFIIGGAEIYRETMPLADKLYITEVHEIIEGDALFPNIEKEIWEETKREDHEAYSFVTYEKRGEVS